MTLLNDNETGRIYKSKHLITIFSVHWMEASFLHIETARIDYSWMSWGGGKGKDDWTLLSGLSSWVTSIIVIMQWWQFTNVCEINSYKQTSIQTRYDHMQYFFSWTRQTWGGKISDMWYLEFVRVNLVLSFIFLCVFRAKKNICEFSFSYNIKRENSTLSPFFWGKRKIENKTKCEIACRLSLSSEIEMKNGKMQQFTLQVNDTKPTTNSNKILRAALKVKITT